MHQFINRKLNMSQLKKKSIEHVLKVEGGYVNDPSDSGGETNWGITKRVALKNDYTGAMRDMPKSLASEIYVKRYWDALALDQVEHLSDIVAAELIDTGVNQGVGRAAETLQRALNALNNMGKLYNDIKIDGDIGPATLSALKKYLAKRGKEGEIVLHRGLNVLQGAFYFDLTERRQKDEKYLYGWLNNRVS